mmetsp:Transcript_94111/g.269463  ORF Transcript_94111/g.269463 Transcript_94111/m.269463 type:complete len:98 (+) Transcript_94111:163-456(+)
MATRGGVSNWRLTEDGKVYRHGRKRYANSDLYDGEFCDGKREGKGVYEYSGGNRYVGEFMNNLYEGFGVFSWACLFAVTATCTRAISKRTSTTAKAF